MHIFWFAPWVLYVLLNKQYSATLKAQRMWATAVESGFSKCYLTKHYIIVFSSLWLLFVCCVNIVCVSFITAWWKVNTGVYRSYFCRFPNYKVSCAEWDFKWMIYFFTFTSVVLFACHKVLNMRIISIEQPLSTNLMLMCVDRTTKAFESECDTYYFTLITFFLNVPFERTITGWHRLVKRTHRLFCFLREV